MLTAMIQKGLQTKSLTSIKPTCLLHRQCRCERNSYLLPSFLLLTSNVPGDSLSTCIAAPWWERRLRIREAHGHSNGQKLSPCPFRIHSSICLPIHTFLGKLKELKSKEAISDPLDICIRIGLLIIPQRS